MNNIAPVYSRECPSNQTMADIFKGSWSSVFPDEYHVIAGDIKHFDSIIDWRVDWGNNILEGGLNGLSVLELGPFEAFNTWQLEKKGVKSLTAIEANNINYLKCLIVKEITGLNARFLYGNFIPFLETCSEKFDVVWASGVLYHSTEPLRLLNAIANVTDKVFIYTHYYDESAIKANPFLYDFHNPANDIFTELDGRQIQLHYRSYNETKDSLFCGGIEAFSYWMEKKDILDCFHSFGFKNITIRLDQLDNPHGPVLCFLAQRKTLDK